ncbi:hypothetical protein Hanom_Chr07g00675821 [Helianthus anomalus]
MHDLSRRSSHWGSLRQGKSFIRSTAPEARRPANAPIKLGSRLTAPPRSLTPFSGLPIPLGKSPS